MRRPAMATSGTPYGTEYGVPLGDLGVADRGAWSAPRACMHGTRVPGPGLCTHGHGSFNFTCSFLPFPSPSAAHNSVGSATGEQMFSLTFFFLFPLLQEEEGAGGPRFKRN